MVPDEVEVTAEIGGDPAFALTAGSGIIQYGRRRPGSAGVSGTRVEDVPVAVPVVDLGDNHVRVSGRGNRGKRSPVAILLGIGTARVHCDP